LPEATLQHIGSRGVLQCVLRLRGGVRGRRRKASGKRRGGYVRKRDTILHRLRDQREKGMRLRQALTAPRVRAAAEAAGRTAPEGSEMADEDVGEGGREAVSAPPFFEDHPAFAHDKLASASGAGKRLRRGAPSPGGARASLSERRKAQLLRLSTAAQEKGDAQAAFFLALRGDHLRVARRLVDSGEVDVNTPDAKSGRTALHDAVQKGELVKAEFLCRFGADLYALDNHFNNPTKVENIDTRTHAVCARNTHAHTLTSVNHFNNPTQMAMDAGNVEMVHLLQQWGGVGVPDAHRHKSRR